MGELLAKRDLITHRSFSQEDKNFILATWLPGLYHGNDWFKEIDETIYESVYPRVIERLLARPSVTTTLACLKEDPTVILAYVVYEGPILHYLFCKSDWRRIGISKDLLPKDLKEFTHLTKIGKSLWKQKWAALKFNPFLIG